MEIAELMEKVECSSFPFGQFRQFVIRDPKLRVISAPRFCERIVHHAVMNVCEPYLDRWLISDSVACRKGLGRNVALSRSSSFAKTYPAYLKLDIRKYFDSIEHATLIRLLAKRFKDESLLALFHDVISSFRGNVRVGLPIGSLTSQHFANFYLGWFDRFGARGFQVGCFERQCCLVKKMPQGAFAKTTNTPRQSFEFERRPKRTFWIAIGSN